MIRKVAVVAESFPKISETFVLQHIKVLLDAGIEVRVFSFVKNPNDNVHPVFSEYKMQQLVQYKPVLPSNFLVRYLKGGYLFIKGLFIDPVAILKSVNIFKYGIRSAKLIDLFELSTFLTRDRFDIIHCHFGTMANQLIRFREMGVLQGRLVCSFHGFDVDGPQLKSSADYYRQLKTEGSAFLANSNYTKQKLLSFGFSENHIRILPVAVDTKKFQPVNRKTAKVFTIVSVARLIEVKGIEYGIRAMYLLKQSGCFDFQYKIIGEGPLRDHLLKLVDELQLSSNVIFMGSLSQDEVSAQFASADLFLLCSIKTNEGREEAQGLALLEAQAMELPVVATNVGGVPDSMRDGETGYLVPQKNPEAIHEKVQLVLNNREQAAELGKNGREWVVRHFDVEIFKNELLNIYNQL